MRSQKIKDLYFSLIRPLTKINYYRGYLQWTFGLARKPHADKIWLNFGSGERYDPSFVNIEGNIFRKKDMWLDLRNALPFPNMSVDAVYACHVIEHFYADELEKILKECHRVLKHEGCIRVLVPSLEAAISSYLEAKKEWFSDFPTRYSSIGGKFFNFVLCDSQHRLVFDYSFTEEILLKAGFKRVVKAEPARSGHFPTHVLCKLEDPETEHIQKSLIVEGWKS
jgi:predicted SAM-dependent methyltransferase